MQFFVDTRGYASAQEAARPLDGGAANPMPRYFFHLHAGDSRANPDKRGQDLPDADAAQQMAQRIARRLLEWNLEPVPWLDYQIQVTDEAGAIVSELPLTVVADQMASESIGAEAKPDVSPRGQLLDKSFEPLSCMRKRA
jgi:hypothetical protein